MKRKYVTIVIAAMIAAAMMAGCGNVSEKTEAETESVTEETTEAETVAVAQATAEDIEMFINGMDDISVLQGTTDFAPCSLIYTDAQIIDGVMADENKVDYSTVGEYMVAYLVVVNDEGYNTYVADKEGYVSNFQQAVVLTELPEEATVVTYEKTISVVTRETAEEMSMDDEAVYTDKGEQAVAGTAVEEKSTEEMNKQASETAKEEAKEEPYSDTKNAPSTDTTKKDSSSDTSKKDSSTDTTKKDTSTDTTKDSTRDTTSETTHQHTWKAVYTTVSHEAEYKTVQHEAEYTTKWVETEPAYDEVVSNNDAWDEDVYENHTFCKDCGMDFTAAGYSQSQVTAHCFDHLDTDNNAKGGYYSKSVKVNTIHHEATTTTVHHDATGYYEKVLVKAAYTEKVLVKAAYDEKVLDHYVCTTCGETKSN